MENQISSSPTLFLVPIMQYHQLDGAQLNLLPHVLFNMVFQLEKNWRRLHQYEMVTQLAKPDIPLCNIKGEAPINFAYHFPECKI